MKKGRTILCFAAWMLVAGLSLAETRIVDNRDQDKAAPERLNLRATAASNGDIIGSYYSGTEVDVSEEEATEGYVHVTVGGKTGFMSEEYLIEPDTYTAQYGTPQGREGQVDLTGLWTTDETLRADAKSESDALASLSDGTSAQVFGFVGNWAYVKVHDEGADKFGYLPVICLTETGNSKAAILMGSDSDGSVPLHASPNAKSEEIMAVQNGTACVLLFGRSGRTWYRVRVGGVAGWVQNDPSTMIFLSGAPRSSVPYYPPLMQVGKETLMTSHPGYNEEAYITLGEGMKVEILGVTKDEEYAYARTFEGSAGAYESGDFGYVPLKNLIATESIGSVGVAQADDGDIPVVLLNTPDKNGRVISALVPGAEVRIGEYTQTD